MADVETICQFFANDWIMQLQLTFREGNISAYILAKLNMVILNNPSTEL